MSIEGIYKASLNTKIAITGKSGTDLVQKKTEKNKKMTDPQSDSIDDSHASKGFAETIGDLKAALNAIPDVRLDKTAEVRAKLEEGYYDKYEVMEQTAGSISDAFRIRA
ncbi:MAG: hypothetical protein AABY76_07170 [Planctomycetota bacterium]